MSSIAKALAQWQEHVTDKLHRQKATVPKEWLIPAIPESQTDVTNIPTTCGVLTGRELEITNVSDVSVLLQKMASGEWSAVEVTTAFSKRAIVAHQAVCTAA